MRCHLGISAPVDLTAKSAGLTIHSSRRRFAARLNSGVRPLMRVLLLLVLALSTSWAVAQDRPNDDKFWRDVEITPERQKLIEDNMLFGAMANELGKRMNAVLGNPGMFSPLEPGLCTKLVVALDAYIASPELAPRTDSAIKDLYDFLDGYHQVYVKLDAMSVPDAKAQVVADLQRDRKHFSDRCESG